MTGIETFRKLPRCTIQQNNTGGHFFENLSKFVFVWSFWILSNAFLCSRYFTTIVHLIFKRASSFKKSSNHYEQFFSLLLKCNWPLNSKYFWTFFSPNILALLVPEILSNTIGIFFLRLFFLYFCHFCTFVSDLYLQR